MTGLFSNGSLVQLRSLDFISRNIGAELDSALFEPLFKLFETNSIVFIFVKFIENVLDFIARDGFINFDHQRLEFLDFEFGVMRKIELIKKVKQIEFRGVNLLSQVGDNEVGFVFELAALESEVGVDVLEEIELVNLVPFDSTGFVLFQGA